MIHHKYIKNIIQKIVDKYPKTNIKGNNFAIFR